MSVGRMARMSLIIAYPEHEKYFRYTGFSGQEKSKVYVFASN